MHHREHVWTMVVLESCKHTFTHICREFENWCILRVLSGKFLRQKSCYPESFRFFLTLHVENPAIRRNKAARTGKTQYKLSLAQPMIPSKPRDTGSKKYKLQKSQQYKVDIKTARIYSSIEVWKAIASSTVLSIVVLHAAFTHQLVE